jgi:hypothetical protein
MIRLTSPIRRTFPKALTLEAFTAFSFRLADERLPLGMCRPGEIEGNYVNQWPLTLWNLTLNLFFKIRCRDRNAADDVRNEYLGA